MRILDAGENVVLISFQKDGLVAKMAVTSSDPRQQPRNQLMFQLESTPTFQIELDGGTIVTATANDFSVTSSRYLVDAEIVDLRTAIEKGYDHVRQILLEQPVLLQIVILKNGDMTPWNEGDEVIRSEDLAPTDQNLEIAVFLAGPRESHRRQEPIKTANSFLDMFLRNSRH